MKQLLSYDFGDPLHCLVIPSKTHEIQDEMLELFEIKDVSSTDENKNENENENDSKDDTTINSNVDNKLAPKKKHIPLVFQYANEVQNRLRQQYIKKQIGATNGTGSNLQENDA